MWHHGTIEAAFMDCRLSSLWNMSCTKRTRGKAYKRAPRFLAKVSEGRQCVFALLAKIDSLFLELSMERHMKALIMPKIVYLLIMVFVGL